MFVFLILLILIGALAFGYTALQARAIEKNHPNIGTLTDIGGYRINAVHLPPPASADLPPLVFIHGASGNLRDQMHAFAEPLNGRAEMLFVDRPGHGYSERGGPQNAFPSGQADAIAALMDKLAIGPAIIIGHSFGGAIAAAFAVRHPQKTVGLLFLAPATHPWPGGIDWYYRLASTPVIGWLFAHTLVIPAGLRRLEQGTSGVFSPNLRPVDYVEKTAPALVLRPNVFRNNAEDVANLLKYVKRQSPEYRRISAPTVIITGNRDDVVLAELHSIGLERDINGAQLITVDNLGHKPDYIVTDLAISAMEHLAGTPRDLQQIARQVEKRIADDMHATSR